MRSPRHRGGDARPQARRGDATAASARAGARDPSANGAGFAERRYLSDGADTLGADLVQAYVDAWPGVIERTADGLVVRRHPKEPGRVGLVIGNGVGHEPAMLGLVGTGLFDVNVPGDVFSAPSPTAIARGIVEADGGAGVLVCVSNHSGDVLSAQMAVELASRDGVSSRMVVLGDDVSTSTDDDVGRRGGAALFFVWKIVGAAAEAGYDLDGCWRIARAVADRSGSLSATIRGTINPTTGQRTVAVPEGTILVGSGVHGDGDGSLLEWRGAGELALTMLSEIVPAIGLEPGDRCLTMVNDSGAMSVAETVILHSGVLRGLTDRGVSVVGSWVGRYATTLATAGFAIGCCKVDDEMLDLWRAPCQSAAICSWGDGPVG